jgi:NAD(P)-dependent dehydrogenase (short-subunit alcohol dehydrogenase family)
MQIQNALVTGASGGLGAAMIAQLLGRSDLKHLWVTSRQPENAQWPQDPRLSPLSLDLTEPSSIDAAAKRVMAEDKALDLLIHCAGMLHDEADGIHPEKRLEQLSEPALARSFAIHATGPFLLTRALFSLLRKSPGALVVNVSARVGSISDNHKGGWYAYRASKAAQNQLTRTLAIELKRRARSVTVVAYHPGTVDTPLSSPFSARVPPEKLFSPALAAERFMEVMGNLKSEDSGGFFSWDGSPIPW